MGESVFLQHQNVYFTVANILLLNDQNQLLILRRSEWKKIPGTDYRPDLSRATDLPGGMVGDDHVEDPTTGVLRELSEETGVEADFDQLRLAYVETVYREQGQRSLARLIYLLKLDYTPVVKLSWEHESFEWRDIREVAGTDYLHSGVCRRAVDYVIAHPNIFQV
ncbi:MAG: NUDIX domain-containing protein [Sphaerimonospora mesophila]